MKVPRYGHDFKIDYFNDHILHGVIQRLTIVSASFRDEIAPIFRLEADDFSDVGVLYNGQIYRGLIAFETRLDETAVSFNRSCVRWQYRAPKEHFPEFWEGFVYRPAFEDHRIDHIFRPWITISRYYAHEELIQNLVTDSSPGFLKRGRDYIRGR